MRWPALVVLALLAGCSSPNPDLYTLAAEPGAVHHGATRSVELRRIGLAGYLDRPEIVRSAAQFRLRVTSNERWGEPLGRMMERVFTEDLVERLPDAAVFGESGAITSNPDRVLQVDVQRFDADAAGRLVLLAQVAIRQGEERAADVRTLRLTAQPDSTKLRDQAAAMSALLAKLADSVAQMLDPASAPQG